VESLEHRVSDELAELMNAWSSLIEEVVRLGAAVGRSNAHGPAIGSQYASEIDELRRSHPDMPEGPLQLLTLDSLGYLSAAGRHCLAVSKLLAAREVFVSLLPLLRAQDRVSKVVTSTLKTDWGEVEYVDEGEGIPVLLSHGIFGGYENAVEIVATYVGPGFRTIGPSRFGYFGSTFPDGATPADQADAYLELLDRLELERVFVAGFSAGSPSAIQMAYAIPTGSRV
jgi:hypothetical protein